MVRITALMDDHAGEHLALVSEHGLSFYIEYGDNHYLFDCGATGMPIQNARRLGVDLHNLAAVILSHSHYDHASGYRELTEQGLASPVLYTGPHFFEKKYARDGIRFTDLSAGFDRQFLEEHGIWHREVEGLREMAPGMWLLNGFPRTHAFETIPERFVRETEEGFVQDDFPDEVCLALKVKGGLVVLVGCSHPGILNMLDVVKEQLKMPIVGVFGGTHLMEADEDRIRITLEKLKEMGVENIGLSHCSGDPALEAIRRDPSMKGCHLGTGDTVYFEE